MKKEEKSDKIIPEQSEIRPLKIDKVEKKDLKPEEEKKPAPIVEEKKQEFKNAEKKDDKKGGPGDSGGDGDKNPGDLNEKEMNDLLE